MKFQLKRSDQLTQGGTALTPNGQYLEFGEIAINYNATDPAIFFKDTLNNVIRISGVGAQIGSGDITLTAGSGISISNPNSFNLQDSYDTNITISVNQGTGSGLDADFLDGQHGSYYRDASNLNAGTISNDRLPSTISSDITGNADTVDGLHAASFLRSDANDTYSGLITGNQLHLGGSQIMNSSASLQVNGFSRQGTIYLHDLTNGVDSPLKNVNGELIWNTDVIWHAGNDGSGSGLDADTVDGLQASSFLRSDANDTFSGNLTSTASSGAFISYNGSNTGPYIKMSTNGTENGYIQFTNTNAYVRNSRTGKFLSISSYISFYDGTSYRTIWHQGNDGHGSGLDADLLDGVHASSFIRSDVNDTVTGRTTWSINATDAIGINKPATNHYAGITFEEVNDPRYLLYVSNVADGRLSLQSRKNGAGFTQIFDAGITGDFTFRVDPIYNDGTFAKFFKSAANWTDFTADSGFTTYYNFVHPTVTGGPTTASRYFSGIQSLLVDNPNYGWEIAGEARNNYTEDLYVRKINNQNYGNWARIWTESAMGSGTGLDADLLDGVHGSSYLRSDIADTATGSLTVGGTTAEKIILSGASQPYIRFKAGTVNVGWVGWQNAAKLVNQSTNRQISVGSDLEYYNGSSYVSVWHASNDGASSGLDADLLDGQQGSAYLRSNANNDSATGSIRTSAQIEAGRGSGSVSLTPNDGYGNANVAFNHRSGVPDATGSSGRIECSVDSTTAHMYFELGNSSTANTARSLSSIMTLTTSSITAASGVSFTGSGSGLTSLPAGNLTGTISDSLIPDTITPVTLVQTKEIRTSNGTEVIINAGESSGKITGQTGEVLYVNAEGGLEVSSPTSANANWQGGTAYHKMRILGNEIQFHNGTTRVGEINTTDTTWLRINQTTAKNIYTPRYIRADGGFFVDSTTKGINGSGNFIGGTIAGASDYGTLLRSNANDTLSAKITGHASNSEVFAVRSASYSGSYINFGGWTTSNSNNISRIRSSTSLHIDSPANGDLYFNWYASNRTIRLGNTGQTVLAAGGNTVWHAGNDGSGSGLDADTVDGLQASSFLNTSSTAQTKTGRLRLMGTPTSDPNRALTIWQSGTTGIYIRNTGSSVGYSLVQESTSFKIKRTYSALTESEGLTLDGSGNLTVAGTIVSPTFDGVVNVGDGAGQDVLQLKKADNNASDHLRFFNGTTRIGEIGCQDTTWLRINQVTNKNIYTPRYIRADNGFFVDGTAKGINGSGNFIGGTISGASDVTDASTSSTVVKRNGSGDINCRLIRQEYQNDSSISGGLVYRVNNSSNNYLRTCNNVGNIRTFLGVTATAGDTNYLRSNASDQYDGQTSGRIMRFRCVDGRDAGSSSGSLFPLEVYQNSNSTNSDAAMTFHIAGRYAAYFGLDRETNDLFFGGWSRGAAKYKVWHAANDGSGSGLDADLLDGQNMINNAATASTIAGRNGSGDIFARLIRQTYQNQSTISGGMVFRVNNSNDNYLRVCNDTGAIRTFLGVTATGADANYLSATANDTATGTITFNGRVNIRGHIDLSDGENLDFGSSDDVRVNYNSNNWLYWDFRTGNGIVYRDNGTDMIILEDSGIFRPATTNTGTIGSSSRYWDNGYFQDFNISNDLNVQNRINVGSSDNGHAIEVDRSSSYDAHLYIGGWSSSNSNNIARIRCSNNLHIDSPADGAMYFNWYSKQNINYKGPLLGGDATSTCRPTNGTVTVPGLSFAGDGDTGFFRHAANHIRITTGGTYRGIMSGGNFSFVGIYDNTVSGGTNVRVDSNGRLRRHSSSRNTKTNIEPMELEYAYKILDEVEPIWYRPRVPDPNYPQEYLDNLAENESPTLADCEAYCQDNGIEWEIGDAWMNEGCNPNWSYWGFIAEDIAEIDPRLCQKNPETGEYDSVQYEEFTPLLLKIAQEQKKTITSLEERLTALEQKFAQCSACDS